jgi:CRISPR-associated protein Csh2
VRLKRYIRDYLQDQGKPIYITKLGGVQNATERLQKLLGDKKSITSEDKDALLKMLIDVRLFGATMPIKGGSKGEAGQSITFIGPVQLNCGSPLNQVSLVDSSTISSQLASEAGKGQGTFGKDYRVYYSLIAFHGMISSRRAEATQLAETDLGLLDEAVLKAIPLLATRSKIGQYPRLYVRFIYTDQNTFAGDFREDLSLANNDGLREISEVSLEINRLKNKLEKVKDRIEKVLVWQDENLCATADGKEVRVAGWLEEILGAGRVDKFPL